MSLKIYKKTVKEMDPVKNDGKINTLQQRCTDTNCQDTMVNKFFYGSM
jgi:hypothetical protein